MPEYLFVFIASGIFTVLGFASRKFDGMDKRVDALELKLAEKYVTKHDFKNHQMVLFTTLTRLEDKIDAHVSEDASRIAHIKRKYYINPSENNDSSNWNP